MQCSDCGSTDNISIADKEFCANCGNSKATPNTTTTPQTTQSTDTNTSTKPVSVADELTQSLQANISNISQPTNQPALQTSPDAIDTSTQKEPSSPSKISSTTKPVENARTIPAPAPTDIATQQPAGKMQVQKPFVPSASQMTGMVFTADSQQAQAKPANNITQKNTAPAVSVGSDSLDLKDKTVFSDSQLEQLAQSNGSIATPSATVRPIQSSSQPRVPSPAMNDILPSSAPQARPQATAQPTLPQPQPLPQNTTLIENTSALRPQPQSTNQPVVLKPSSTVSAANTSSLTADNTAQRSASKTSSKLASVALSVVGLVLLGAYVWQVNYPNLALKVASSKAGISASLPSYIPSGWKITGDISSNPGSVSFKLSSPGNQNIVTVNQSRTDWDSQALAENYLANKTKAYTSLQAQGLTIYLYENNQASWVNHGTWYRLEGSNHGLTREQIIKMATSL